MSAKDLRTARELLDAYKIDIAYNHVYKDGLMVERLAAALAQARWEGAAQFRESCIRVIDAHQSGTKPLSGAAYYAEYYVSVVENLPLPKVEL